MNRKEFVKSCGLSCMGLLVGSTLLQSCAGTKYVDAGIEGDSMVVPLNEFEIRKEKQLEYRKYVVVQNESLEYPICVYRINENKYQALWMKCTHQGTELQVFGDKLHCPAHGSEFANTGAIQNGPAADPLRTFAVTVSDDNLKIILR